ncbi:MAG: CHAD domain-containing protein [Betaproteobacteria bacterium]|nr:CHAD domain-containing protein [Betaproteobacteria bacterium]
MLEAEIKLLIDPADTSRLKSHPLLARLAVKRPYTRLLENRYYDTADLALASQGAALRLRRQGSRWLQSLKAGNTHSAGLHLRQEWETPVRRAALDLGRLGLLLEPGDPLAQTLQMVAGKLKPRVLTRYRRTYWNLHSDRGDVIELVLDLGEIMVGRRRLPIAELELELKAGRLLALYEVALALTTDLPLALGELGKAERGFALLQAPDWFPVTAKRVAVEAGTDGPALIRAIVGNCLEQVAGNVRLLRSPAPDGPPRDEGEAVHQWRVGLRRLRAALKLFAPIAPLPEPWAAEIRLAADRVGPARDWDVLGNVTLALLPQARRPPGWEALQAAARERAQELRQGALAAFEPARDARWQLALLAWALALAEHNPFQETPEAWARQVLKGLQGRLAKRGRRLIQGSDEERHRVRIAAKQLRYALEFLAPMLDKNATRRHLRALAGLQEALGQLNDAAVADGLLGELTAARPELAGPGNFARGWLAAFAQARIASLEEAWAPVVRDLRRR